MLPLLKMFWGICRLQVPPQDLPTSRILMLSAILCYFVASLVVAWIQLAPHLAIPAALLDTAFLSAMAAVVLWVQSHVSRFPQTITALAGSGAMLTAIAVPVVLWQQQATAGNPEAGLILPSLLLLLWTAWNIVVVGHILRHALSTIFAVGIVLAVAYMYLAFKLAGVLFFV